MNLPPSFVDYMRALIGPTEYEKLESSLQLDPPSSLRVNEMKLEKNHSAYGSSPEQIVEPSFYKRLSAANRVLWAKTGYYLDDRLTYTFDPLFHAGCYYVQEASSMFLEQAVKQYIKSPSIMLDLCASPGGKSTHACSVLPQGSLLVSNELMRNRSQVLAENLTKWGSPNVVVANNSPADYTVLTDFFDVILTDVPCSGEGMFRKDPVAVKEWSPENVENCWQRQRTIIADIWPALKPGGILIYSTCTFNAKEDEENIHWISDQYGAEMLRLRVEEDWNITGALLQADGTSIIPPITVGKEYKGEPMYHFFPYKSKGEGFFLAVLRKPGTPDDSSDYSYSLSKSSGKKEKNKKGAVSSGTVSKENMSIAKSWLKEEVVDDYELLAIGSSIRAFPKQYMNQLIVLKQHLRIVQAGITVGEVKGNDLIPAHALAMCPSLLRPDAFQTEELSYEQAIAYLRKEAITLSEMTSRGYVLLTYRHIPLGFVKHVGNRANNLYPQEWRIRSGYLPDEVKIL